MNLFSLFCVFQGINCCSEQICCKNRVIKGFFKTRFVTIIPNAECKVNYKFLCKCKLISSGTYMFHKFLVIYSLFAAIHFFNRYQSLCRFHKQNDMYSLYKYTCANFNRGTIYSKEIAISLIKALLVSYPFPFKKIKKMHFKITFYCPSALLLLQI